MATNNKGNNNNHQVQFPQQQLQAEEQHQQQQLQQISYGMMMQSTTQSSLPANNFISSGKDSGGNNHTTTSSTGAYDLGELDQALFMYFDGHDHQNQHQPSSAQEQRHQNSTTGIRPPTLNIFPSQPMHVEPSPTRPIGTSNLISSKSSGVGGAKRPSEVPSSMELSSRNNNDIASGNSEASKVIKNSFLGRNSYKTPDPKTLRRLAQNREAARKSRLRKKAYVQQLESSRIKLTQLEQELQRARAQGVFLGGGAHLLGDQGLPGGISNISSEAAVFDMEYARWLEEHHRIMCELQAAVQEHLPENELRLFVENCLAHYDELIGLKNMIVKTDVFHLFSGMWKTPAERCFIWMGGFKPSELIKMLLNQIEPLSEQQILGICGLQQSTQEAEEALSQGLDALHQSLSDTIASDALSYPSNMGNYMGQMAVAMNKISTLEGFVRQADNLRHQTLHRLYQLLTARQSARCFLAIAEYFHRLRALSSLWLSRPRQE
ncbi:hypothetical protein MKW92_034983 [Papaver armeniacum]|nr:hypothetical protein MKW92_034983 [Papaver armeniacum]